MLKIPYILFLSIREPARKSAHGNFFFRAFPWYELKGKEARGTVTRLCFLSLGHREEAGEESLLLLSSDNFRALRACTTGKVGTRTLGPGGF